LLNEYDPGANNLLVTVNGAVQYPLTTALPKGNYIELDGKTIRFPNDSLKPDDTVTVFISKLLSNVNHNVDVWRRDVLNPNVGATVFTLPEEKIYERGNYNLEVYVDGVLQIPDYPDTDTDLADYVEISNTQIQFVVGLAENQIITFKIGNVIANTAGTTNNLLSVDTIPQFLLVNPQDKTRTVMTKGYLVAGDGGAAVYIYDTTLDKARADGLNVVDMSQSLENQGSGTGTGCWHRIIPHPSQPLLAITS
jgi:hypothetical protein